MIRERTSTIYPPYLTYRKTRTNVTNHGFTEFPCVVTHIVSKIFKPRSIPVESGIIVVSKIFTILRLIKLIRINVSHVDKKNAFKKKYFLTQDKLTQNK